MKHKKSEEKQQYLSKKCKINLIKEKNFSNEFKHKAIKTFYKGR